MPSESNKLSARDNILTTRPPIEQFDGCTIYWSEMEHRVSRNGSRRLMVRVVCKGCQKEQWKVTSSFIYCIKNEAFNGYCKQCYNTCGGIRLNRRIQKEIAKKPPIEIREKAVIHWNSVKIDPVDKKHTIKVVCTDCGEERWVLWSSIRAIDGLRGGRDGRCRLCAAKRSRGPGNKRWKGGRSRTSEGYVCVYVAREDPFHCMAFNSCQVLEHRLVMARKLGRPLRRHEHVHHINGQKDDNRPENLLLVNKTNHCLITKLDKRIEHLESLLREHEIPVAL